MNHNVSMNPDRLSTLYTLSFTRPRIDPYYNGGFCVYFIIETYGTETFICDLALFIRILGQKLAQWSVLGSHNRLDPTNPAHPTLHDITYCWDGIACGYGVLQFRAPPASLMNIRRMFHRASQICDPFCETHQYEYLASGMYSDVEQMSIPRVFTEIEAIAKCI